jgi:hypothetical protein
VSPRSTRNCPDAQSPTNDTTDLPPKLSPNEESGHVHRTSRVIRFSPEEPAPEPSRRTFIATTTVSGSAVVGAVYDLRQQMLQDGGNPARARFGYSDDDAFAVGLAQAQLIETP